MKVYIILILLICSSITSFSQNAENSFKYELSNIDLALKHGETGKIVYHIQQAENLKEIGDSLLFELDIRKIIISAIDKKYIDANIILKKVQSSLYYKEVQLNERGVDIALIAREANKESISLIYQNELMASFNNTKSENSINSYKKFIDKYPNSSYASEVRGLLLKLFIKSNEEIDKENLDYLKWYSYNDLNIEIENDKVGRAYSNKTKIRNEFPNIIQFLIWDAEIKSNKDLFSLYNTFNRIQSLTLNKCLVDEKVLSLGKSKQFGSKVDKKLTTLSIFDCGYKAIDLSNFKRLKSVEFYKIPLVKAPIIGSDSLESIVINNCPITKISKIITSHKKLKTLVLLDTKISIIPNEILLLSNLEKLEINSKVTIISPNLFKLPNLKFLSIKKLSISPNFKFDVSNLPKLESLMIGSDEITVIPKEIFQINGIKVLELRFPKIKELNFYDITNLKKLEDFRLLNYSGVIPENIQNFRKLKSLTLFACNLETFPDLINKFPNLSELDLSDNKVAIFPEDLSTIISLKKFTFLNNPVPIYEVLRLRLTLPNTELIYSNTIGANAEKSKPIDLNQIVKLKKNYEEYKTNNLESTYELAMFFKERGDLSIAKYILEPEANSYNLTGSTNSLRSMYEIAEIYNKYENPLDYIRNISSIYYVDPINYYRQSSAYKNYVKTCNCNAKDKDGLIYIRNSCAMALEMNGQARDRIKSIFPQLEREFDGLNQDADSRYNNQKTIKDLGAAADLGGLDELTGGSGIGAATGEIFGLIAQGQAEKKERAAEVKKEEQKKLISLVTPIINDLKYFDNRLNQLK